MNSLRVVIQKGSKRTKDQNGQSLLITYRFIEFLVNKPGQVRAVFDESELQRSTL